MLKTRFSRCAQVMAARRSACVWSCASSGAVLAIGGKYTVETGQVYSRFRHQCRQLGNEIQRLKDDVGSAVVVGRLELVSDIP